MLLRRRKMLVTDEVDGNVVVRMENFRFIIRTCDVIHELILIVDQSLPFQWLFLMIQIPCSCPHSKQ